MDKPANVSSAGQHKWALTYSLMLTGSFMIAEVVTGFLTGSLALLADAAHMMTDFGGMALALIAIKFAERPATPEKTFGYVRLEVLSALTNAVVLLLLAIYILYEAWQRFQNPEDITGLPMLIVAVTGLVVNLISMKLLSAGAEQSLNMKGAYFEVLGDMLGSVGVIVAAMIVLSTGWRQADALIGAGIGLFIVPRTWNLLKQAVHILMEGTPPEVDMKLLKEKLTGIAGVTGISDLHVWTITSGIDAMSGHLQVDSAADREAVLLQATEAMLREFKISHTTIQIDREKSAGEGAAHRF